MKATGSVLLGLPKSFVAEFCGRLVRLQSLLLVRVYTSANYYGATRCTLAAAHWLHCYMHWQQHIDSTHTSSNTLTATHTLHGSSRLALLLSTLAALLLQAGAYSQRN